MIDGRYPAALEDAVSYVKDCMDKGEDRQLTRAIVADGKAVGSIGIFLGSDVYEKSALYEAGRSW